jgi:soluble lytic murein transglycosylase-like protein
VGALSVEAVTTTIAQGAMGLMQIMPKTWGESRARYGLAADPFEPHDNILAGAGYIRELNDCYNRRGASPPTMQTLDVTKII